MIRAPSTFCKIVSSSPTISIAGGFTNPHIGMDVQFQHVLYHQSRYPRALSSVANLPPTGPAPMMTTSYIVVLCNNQSCQGCAASLLCKAISYLSIFLHVQYCCERFSSFGDEIIERTNLAFFDEFLCFLSSNSPLADFSQEGNFAAF